MRREKGKACGKISAKALAVHTALLWRFHNAARRGRRLRQEHPVGGDPALEQVGVPS